MRALPLGSAFPDFSRYNPVGQRAYADFGAPLGPWAARVSEADPGGGPGRSPCTKLIYESVFRELSTVVKEILDAHVLLPDTLDQSPRRGTKSRQTALWMRTRAPNRGTFTALTPLGLPGVALLYRS